MPVNPAAENALGTLGAVCWTIQLLPQIWKSWRTKSTEGLSAYLVFMWGIVGCPLGIYNILQNLSTPLVVQPQLFGFFCIISWGQCQFYGSKRPVHVAVLMSLTVMVIMGGLEVGMVYAIRPSGNSGAILFFGILSAVMISTALIPQFYEIWKYKEVKGISKLFVTIDCMGGLFSAISLVFSTNKLDVLACISYSLVFVLDGLILVAAVILNPRAERRKQALEQEISVAPTADTISLH